MTSSKLRVGMGLLLVLGFWGWQKFRGSLGQTPQYQTARVERGTLVSSVSASGQILNSGVLEITTSASGVIKRLFVANGEKVAVGSKIAEIELDSIGRQKRASVWSNYLSAKNSLDAAKTALYGLQSQMFAANQKFINDAVARNLKTGDPTYIQQSADWLAAEGKYKNQQAVIDQGRAAMENARLSYEQTASIVTAAAAGVVDNITIASGMVISGQTTTSRTIALIKKNEIRLATFNFAEMDVSRLQIGQRAVITVEAISEKSYSGKVVAMDRVGQVTNNVTNYPTLIQLDTNPLELLPNMSVNASVIIETRDDVLFVPSSAIQMENEVATVRVVKEKGKVDRVPVEVGISGEAEVEIVAGLREGEGVVVGTISPSQREFSSPLGGFGGGFGGRVIRQR